MKANPPLHELAVPSFAHPNRPEDYEYVWGHARARLWERYRLRLDLGEYIALCQCLARAAAEECLPVATVKDRETPRGRVIVNVRVHGTATRAAYSLRSGLILTFLPYHRAGGGSAEQGERAWVRRQRRRERAYQRHPKHRGQP